MTSSRRCRFLARFLGCFLTAGFIAWSAGAARAQGGNPFGVQIGGGGLVTQSRIALAKQLGVTYVRPYDLILAEWGGLQRDAEAFQEAGFRLVLTVRNSGRAGISPKPSQPPSDPASYEKKLGGVLTKYRPALLVVEDEESSALTWKGSPERYVELLGRACAIAHARELRCTNGGLGGEIVALLAADHLQADGQADAAEDFLHRALTDAERATMRGPTGREHAQHSIEQGKTLLAGYATAHVDFVNFHWYGSDPKALEEAVMFLRRATGLPAVTNEIGQRDSEADRVAPILASVRRLGLPIAVWSSVDGADARALQNPDGSIRSNGDAFVGFIRDAFGCNTCGVR